MKYSVLCVAVCAALVGQAYAFTPKLSGTLKAHLKSDNYDGLSTNLATNIDTKTKQSRNHLDGESRLRVSGSQKLNDVLTAAYSLEYNVALDNDDSTRNFTSRSTYASLEHKDYGRVRYGRMTSPENDFDMGAAQSTLVGGALPFSSFGVRSSNAFQYYSPYFGKDKGMRIKLHYGMDENSEHDTAVRTYINDSRRTIRRDLAVAQITYSNKTVGFGLTYSQAGSDFNAIAGMASYRKDRFDAGLVARVADFNSGRKESGVLGSLSYTLDNSWRAYGQVGYSQNFEGRDIDLTSTAVGIGKEIKGDKGRASVFAEVAGELYKGNQTDRSGNQIRVDDKTYGAAVGLNYRF